MLGLIAEGVSLSKYKTLISLAPPILSRCSYVRFLFAMLPMSQATAEASVFTIIERPTTITGEDHPAVTDELGMAVVQPISIAVGVTGHLPFFKLSFQ